MVPAHYVVEIALVGCPDPDPDLHALLHAARPTPCPRPRRDRPALHRRASRRSRQVAAAVDAADSRDADRRRVLRRHRQRRRVPRRLSHDAARSACRPARLKAFVLNLGGGPGRRAGPRVPVEPSACRCSSRRLTASPAGLDVDATRCASIEDYKPLDVECAAMGLALCRGIRARYPDWRHLVDGDGGDENLKDYPIEENPELTIRSVVNNLMLYQEGWGVGRIKHSLTYSGGLSRSYVRTYAPARRYGFDGFSPYTQPDVVEVAEGIPFAALTGYDVPTLYAPEGRHRRDRGVKAVTGLDMPVFPKRRFQHGAVPADAHARAPGRRRSAPTAGRSTACTPDRDVSGLSGRTRRRATGSSLDRRGAAARRTIPGRASRRHRRGRARRPDGVIAESATVFLTGRECPWRCVMCDLWRHTTTADTPPGAIAAQIGGGRDRRSRSADAARADQAVQRRQLLRSAGRARRRTTTASAAPLAASTTSSSNRTRRWSARARRAVPRRAAAVAGVPSARARSGHGTRDRAPGRARSPEQADDGRATSRAPRRGCAARASRCACSCSSLRRSCPRDEQDAWLVRSVDVAPRPAAPRSSR